mmetsp:Transcript_5109/g.16722  ORF Transcript_5109/g.16722 Transcript_5109/m.16722 type:complete len:245 (-) Transcript_5109:733-1467(-)
MDESFLEPPKRRRRRRSSIRTSLDETPKEDLLLWKTAGGKKAHFSAAEAATRSSPTTPQAQQEVPCSPDVAAAVEALVRVAQRPVAQLPVVPQPVAQLPVVPVVPVAQQADCELAPAVAQQPVVPVVPQAAQQADFELAPALTQTNGTYLRTEHKRGQPNDTDLWTKPKRGRRTIGPFKLSRAEVSRRYNNQKKVVGDLRLKMSTLNYYKGIYRTKFTDNEMKRPEHFETWLQEYVSITVERIV